MTPDARGLLTDDVASELLLRWAEPHREYHDTGHLVHGLAALDLLGGSRLERIAFWFHDAVHSNSSPQDEEASATLVADLLAGQESSTDISEIQRLVMLTAGHRTATGDAAGQRVCDADLSALGADETTYRRNVRGIRAELPHLDDAQWVLGRRAFLIRFLERDHFFATDFARQRWEAAARRNLLDELANLREQKPTLRPPRLS